MKRSVAFELGLLLLTVACTSSFGELRSAAPEAGKAQWFDASSVELLDVARSVLASTKYRVREQKHDGDTSWYAIGTRGSRHGCLSDALGTRGSGCPIYEVVRVRVVASTPDSSRVWVYTQDEVLTVGRPEMILTEMARELCRRRPSTCQ